VIRVLIVDDSAVARQSLRFILESHDSLTVVGEAKNGEEAIAMTERLEPDVITMDIRMPRMDGLEAVQRIMESNPVPIVIVTSVDLSEEAELSREAMRRGALSVVERPTTVDDRARERFARRLVRKVKLMSDVKVVHRSRSTRSTTPKNPGVAKPAPVPRPKAAKIEIAAIGASTGGPAALHQVIGSLPEDFPVPILVVQHISFGFVDGLASWLDKDCALRVKVAEARDRVEAGVVYIAPDDHHLGISSYGRVRLSTDGNVDGHRPSATYLFNAVAQSYGPAAVAAILTGMGRDGAAGMKALHDRGAVTIAQNEESCVVFGMPKEAIALGAIDREISLDQIGPTFASLCRQNTG
jgi:two-component system chemotaxis response regulator CheB